MWWLAMLLVADSALAHRAFMVEVRAGGSLAVEAS